MRRAAAAAGARLVMWVVVAGGLVLLALVGVGIVLARVVDGPGGRR